MVWVPASEGLITALGLAQEDGVPGDGALMVAQMDIQPGPPPYAGHRQFRFEFSAVALPDIVGMDRLAAE